MANAPPGMIDVELVYAPPGALVTEILQVPVGTSIGRAIEQSGVIARHPELATQSLKIGIFGRRVAASTILREFDRIEIYRPLIADPKQVRRARARPTGKSTRAGR